MYLLSFDNGSNVSMLWVNQDLKIQWIALSSAFTLVSTKVDDQLVAWCKEINKLLDPSYAKTKVYPMTSEMVQCFLKNQQFTILKGS